MSAPGRHVATILATIVTGSIALALALPAVAQTALDEARELAVEGRAADALARLDSAPATETASAEHRFLRGVLLAELGRRVDAVEVFTELTDDYPALPEPYNNLAVLFAADGRYDEARAALISATAINPGYATAHENLGDIYAKLAVISYRKAVEIDPGNGIALFKQDTLQALFADRAIAPRAAALAGATPAPEPAATVMAEPVAAAAPVAAAGAAPVEQTRAVPDGGAIAEVDSDLRGDLLAVVDSWARAWSAQDVDAYLAHYSDGFAPSDGSERARWAQTRRSRLRRPSFIAVTVSNAEVELLADGSAWVSFDQAYDSDGYADVVRKRLELVRTDDGWKIEGERSVR